MSLSQSNYNPHVWGFIKKNNGSSTAYDQTGTNFNPNVTQDDGAGFKRRAYFSFDTSGIPDGAVIDLHEFSFKFNSVNEPVGFAGTWQLSVYYEHDRIGASLDTGDWGFSALAGTKNWSSTPSTWVEYTAALSVSSVTKEGDTDLEIRNTGIYADPPGAIFYKIASRRAGPVYHSYLTVGYLLQGVLGKTPSGNISFYGGMCLAALTRFLMATGIIPPNSAVDRIDGSDVHIVTRFVPRTVGACIQ